MLHIVFMRWTDPAGRWNQYYQYRIEHVMRAQNMVRRNLSIPHKFVLATDEVDEVIDGDDKIVPIPKYLLRLGHRWPKLMLFGPNARELFGERFCYMDLDQVTVDKLDPLLDCKDEFKIMCGTVRGRRNMPYNSSMILMNAGARDKVWNHFDPARAEQMRQENGILASDQYWIGQCLGPREPVWEPRDGVLQFREIMHDPKLPRGARVVFFPGPFDPSMPDIRAQYPWIEAHWR